MLTKKISQTLSLRLSLMVVCVIALLLLVSMAAMYFFSRQALREEALCNAQETLESTVQDVDNILLSVEQSTGNIYWDLLGHLNEPENMIKYSKPTSIGKVTNLPLTKRQSSSSRTPLPTSHTPNRYGTQNLWRQDNPFGLIH